MVIHGDGTVIDQPVPDMSLQLDIHSNDASDTPAANSDQLCADSGDAPDTPAAISDVLPSSSDVLTRCWTNKPQGILLCRMGPYNLTDHSFRYLRSTLSEEVVDSSIHLLASNSKTKKVLHIPSSIASAIFSDPSTIDGFLQQCKLEDYDVLIGACIENGNHWTLVVIYPKKGKLIYLNPLGEQPGRAEEICDRWRHLLIQRHTEGYVPYTGTWVWETPAHSKQRDTKSCGVYVLKFAECLVRDDSLHFADTKKDLVNLRRSLGIQLLEAAESVDDYCRTCYSKDDKNDKNNFWVRCDSCVPEKKFHNQCLDKPFTTKTVNSPFHCGMCMEEALHAQEAVSSENTLRMNTMFAQYISKSSNVQTEPGTFQELPMVILNRNNSHHGDLLKEKVILPRAYVSSGDNSQWTNTTQQGMGTLVNDEVNVGELYNVGCGKAKQEVHNRLKHESPPSSPPQLTPALQTTAKKPGRKRQAAEVPSVEVGERYNVRSGKANQVDIALIQAAGTEKETLNRVKHGSPPSSPPQPTPAPQTTAKKPGRKRKAAEVPSPWSCHDCQTPPLPVQMDLDYSTIIDVTPTDVPASCKFQIPNAIALTSTSPLLTDDHPDSAIDAPIPILEKSLAYPILNEYIPDGPVTFEVVEGGTKRGGRKLVSSDGYTYTVKKSNENYTYWYCPVRRKTIRCRATVSQHADKFKRGRHSHEHQAEPGVIMKTKISAEVKAIAKEQLLRPAADIVDVVMKENVAAGSHSLPKPDNLIRAANHFRQELHPVDPISDCLDFQESVIPDLPELTVDDILEVCNEDAEVDTAMTGKMPNLDMLRGPI